MKQKTREQELKEEIKKIEKGCKKGYEDCWKGNVFEGTCEETDGLCEECFEKLLECKAELKGIQETKKKLYQDEIDFLEGYFGKNGRYEVILPELEVKATEVIKKRIQELKQKIKGM